MDDLRLGSRLFSFKTKIDDAVALVPEMTAEEKLRAVQWWNVVSEQLQEIVNDSAADINALASRFEDEELNNKNELVDGIENKNFDNFDSNLTNGNNLTTQSEDEPLDFPDIPTPNLPNPELDSSTTRLTNGRVSDHTISLNLENSELNISQGSSHLSSTPSNSQSLNDTNIGESLSMNEDRNRAREYQNADQLSSMENESLHFSPDDVNAPISDLTDISAGTNVLFDLEQTSRNNVIQSASKHHVNQTLESSINDSNSSLADNLGVESESSFISENGENNLNIDRFDVSHVPLDIETDTNSLETLIVNQTDPAQPLLGTSMEKSMEPNLIPSNEEITKANNGHKWNHSKPFICEECGAKFSTKGNLLVHQRRHTGEKPFACDKCPAIFSTKGNLRRHIKAHSGERSWKCEICNSKFTEKKSLKVHMRRHTGERPYKCTVCNKAFSQTGVLQTHMALHLDERKYLCEMCGKAFRQRSQLRLHVLRHEGVKKWDCSNCEAKFLTKGDLERHFRIHTGERPFICSLCGKTFTRQQSLNEHSNRHYGLKPYSCDVCNKKFSEMSACYKHIKIHKKQEKNVEPDNPDLGNQVSHFPELSSSNGDHLSSQPIIN